MTNEERDIITQFIGRVGGAPAGGQPGQFGGSVPATAQPALPPVDPEADGLIRQMFQRYPEAPYRIAQLAFVQEHALAEAQNRIQRLEWELQQARTAQPAPAQQPQGAGAGASGGFFSGLFGGRSQTAAPQPGPGPAWNQGGAMPPPQPQYQQAPPPPPPQYAPNYQPGMFQPQGSGFLGSALRTAAGVAGGVVAGNLLMDMFSGRRAEGGFGGGYPAGPGMESPWGGGGAGGMPQQGYVDQGSWDNSGGGGSAPQDQNYVDNGSWDQPANNAGGDAGWDSSSNDSNWDSSGSSDSGWDSGGGGGDSGGGSDSLC